MLEGGVSSETTFQVEQSMFLQLPGIRTKSVKNYKGAVGMDVFWSVAEC